MNSICVIGVYFGHFPNYFPLWLKSCEFNPKIDFFIFTDQEISDVPVNVKVVVCDLAFVNQLAGHKLGFKISLERPYKLCDFKPAYGLIFEDYISKYEYWGHTDFDMIYGDIHAIMLKHDYGNYDKFLPLGHLAFYKNTKEVNDNFKLPGSKCGDYKEVFTSDRSCIFDELGGIWEIYEKNNLPKFDKPVMIDVSIYFNRFKFALNRITKVNRNYFFQTFYWEDGHVYRAYYKMGKVKIEEYIYIHFKKRKFRNPDFDVENSKSFYITPSGFIEKQPGVPTLLDIVRTNKPQPIYEAKQLLKIKLKYI